MFLKMETNIIYYSWNANEKKCMIYKGDVTFRPEYHRSSLCRGFEYQM